ncbi:MAG: hypothetical protein A3H02_02130 [Candidatus Niyogibacteria bacterium RIFCSPLOWO2_12_FULL_41_13]|uniref:Phospholipid/glycerol acyltransferase domain-containing protein n=1 Tax=Candidatus Niyogibacteria bacterium RIFCSPLOWO2_12_FULL_41_13 TaxID=1801726 RepID=A0A1G2F3U0_9BACT|nr:MAG: hypothetical protein A3H02_02130 [Candidatus Niyogibacteria bacterium RIFCSPLOWO2_12_FULL_41_13]
MNWRKIVWMFFWPLYRLFAELFFQFEIKGGENLKNLKKPFILAANHASYLDGEFIVVAFPWNSEFFPIRYMAAEYYYKKLFLGSILWLLGGFQVVQGIGLDESLAPAVSLLLKNSDVVGVFPEGKITKDGNFGEGKPGVAYLALKTNLPVLPVNISGSFGLNNIKTVVFGRKKVGITFGKPFYLKDYVGEHNPDPEKDKEILIKGTKIVMEKIKDTL